jgi:transcription elongation factor SPT4
MGQFKAVGCENCDDVLHMKGSVERVYDCTSGAFSGVVGLTADAFASPNSSAINSTLQDTNRPDQSWVSRYLRLQHALPGVYAVSVQGRLPEDIQASLANKGIAYRPRDNYTS